MSDSLKLYFGTLATAEGDEILLAQNDDHGEIVIEAEVLEYKSASDYDAFAGDVIAAAEQVKWRRFDFIVEATDLYCAYRAPTAAATAATSAATVYAINALRGSGSSYMLSLVLGSGAFTALVAQHALNCPVPIRQLPRAGLLVSADLDTIAIEQKPIGQPNGLFFDYAVERSLAETHELLPESADLFEGSDTTYIHDIANILDVDKQGSDSSTSPSETKGNFQGAPGDGREALPSGRMQPIDATPDVETITRREREIREAKRSVWKSVFKRGAKRYPQRSEERLTKSVEYAIEKTNPRPLKGEIDSGRQQGRAGG